MGGVSAMVFNTADLASVTIILVVLSHCLSFSKSATCSELPETQFDCEQTLLPGQYYCTSPDIDINSQTAIGCRSNGTVLVTCHAAPNVTCSNITEYDSDEVVFCREEKCRYVNGQRYNYYVAVALSLFLGMFGIDRFYLGYPAIGLLKLCTVGFFFIGQLVDFILILVQAVGPSDRSEYYSPFYGPLLIQVNTTNTYFEVTDEPCV